MNDFAGSLDQDRCDVDVDVVDQASLQELPADGG